MMSVNRTFPTGREKDEEENPVRNWSNEWSLNLLSSTCIIQIPSNWSFEKMIYNLHMYIVHNVFHLIYHRKQHIQQFCLSLIIDEWVSGTLIIKNRFIISINNNIIWF